MSPKPKVEKQERWLLSVILLAAVMAFGFASFIVSLEGVQQLWSLMMSSAADGSFFHSLLEKSLQRPLAGLVGGILITSLLQSSSTSIAIVIASTASGAIPLQAAIFMVLGANIGTSIMNAIVSLSYSNRKDEFTRAVPAALIDDLYKVIFCGFFFVVEVIASPIYRICTRLGTALGSSMDPAWLRADGQGWLRWPEHWVKDVIQWTLSFLAQPYLGTALLVLATLILLQFSIRTISWSAEGILKALRFDLTASLESDRKPKAFLGLGFLMCWFLQSSSLTLSLAIPFASKRWLSLENLLFFSAGAALATTCSPTQLVTYGKFGPAGLAVGFSHFFVNIVAVSAILLSQKFRQITLGMARYIGSKISSHRAGAFLLVIYIALIFYILPLSILVFF